MVQYKKYKTPQQKEVIREEHTENGKFHRVDGPAIVVDGLEAWYINGNLHRDNNEPAITDAITGYKAWFINGVCQKVIVGDVIKYERK